MANSSDFTTQRRATTGDVAVDGLLAGMGAGLAMGFLLLLAGLLSGVAPGEMLGRFDPANNGDPLVGGLLHLAVSGIYGAIFALLFRLLRRRWPVIARYSWLVGGVYGLLLWLAAQVVFLPGMNSALSLIPPLQFAAAHIVYGLVLGYLIGRHQATR